MSFEHVYVYVSYRFFPFERPNIKYLFVISLLKSVVPVELRSWGKHGSCLLPTG